MPMLELTFWTTVRNRGSSKAAAMHDAKANTARHPTPMSKQVLKPEREAAAPLSDPGGVGDETKSPVMASSNYVSWRLVQALSCILLFFWNMKPSIILHG